MNNLTDAYGPIALTMGEPAGIGPELAAKAWHLRDEAKVPPFVLIGDPDVFAPFSDVSVISFSADTDPADLRAAFADALPVITVALAAAPRPGKPDPSNAKTVAACIEKAVRLVQDHQASAVVTNPIQKSTLYDAGFAFRGHTDFLAGLAGLEPNEVAMMLAIDGLRVVPVTIHLALRDVSEALTGPAIQRAARITHDDLRRRFGIARPRLKVAALNPHAGELGAMGSEEIDIIAPAVAALTDDGIDVSGPHPADTLFHERARADCDAVICMYHDQALIPIKALDFDHGVNITLGLPFVRTSPDHGTALDIAGTGAASADSLIAALQAASRLTLPDRPDG